MGGRAAAVAGTMAAVLAVTGYVVGDVYDVVPGILTNKPDPASDSSEALPVPTAAVAVPSGAPSAATATASALAVATGGDKVTDAGVRKALAPLVRSPHMGDAGSDSSVVVLDAASGKQLFGLNEGKARTPASVAKLASAAVVATSMPLETRLRTRVVKGAKEGEVVLVAGGDSLLNPDYGDPSSVVGRAGLADLADDTAAALRDLGDAKVTVVVDDSYAKGPVDGPTWVDGYLKQGFTGPITMLALSTERAEPDHPAPTDPPLSAAKKFRDLLRARGLQVEDEPTRGKAPAKAQEYGAVDSAPVRDILREALLSSDNAITESLARQAAARNGVKDLTTPSVGRWVLTRLGTLGVQTSGLKLMDVSGLGSGSLLTASLLGRLLAMAADGKHPEIASAYAALPVAGASGTLSDRFNIPGRNTNGRGFVRAKTGSLPAVSALAGTVETKGGRLLVYVGIINRDENVLELRAALDDIGSALADCGCEG